LDKLCHQLPWKQKRGHFRNFGIPFTKLHENIHRSVWQLLELKKFKMAAVGHGAKNVKFTPYSDPFETRHKNKLSLKVVLFVLKVFKMAPISKWPPI
jgi:hypothetical protein